MSFMLCMREKLFVFCELIWCFYKMVRIIYSYGCLKNTKDINPSSFAFWQFIICLVVFFFCLSFFLLVCFVCLFVSICGRDVCKFIFPYLSADGFLLMCLVVRPETIQQTSERLTFFFYFVQFYLFTDWVACDYWLVYLRF